MAAMGVCHTAAGWTSTRLEVQDHKGFQCPLVLLDFGLLPTYCAIELVSGGCGFQGRVMHVEVGVFRTFQASGHCRSRRTRMELVLRLTGFCLGRRLV